MSTKKIVQIAYEFLDSWEELNYEDIELVKRAYAISEGAYAPYSKFHVGAAVKLSSGNILSGSNQENIAFPSGLCAERVALFYAGANFPSEQVNTLCVVAKGELLDIEKLLSPCGSCRQVMVETEMRQQKNMRVILVSQNKKTIVFNSATDLLPFAFGKI
jgi:cytidine deaminase